MTGVKLPSEFSGVFLNLFNFNALVEKDRDSPRGKELLVGITSGNTRNLRSVLIHVLNKPLLRILIRRANDAFFPVLQSKRPTLTKAAKIRVSECVLNALVPACVYTEEPSN